jgi:hypothetical protein
MNTYARSSPASFFQPTPAAGIATTPSSATMMAIKQTLSEFEQGRNPIASSVNAVHSAI